MLGERGCGVMGGMLWGWDGGDRVGGLHRLGAGTPKHRVWVAAGGGGHEVGSSPTWGQGEAEHRVRAALPLQCVGTW